MFPIIDQCLKRTFLLISIIAPTRRIRDEKKKHPTCPNIIQFRAVTGTEFIRGNNEEKGG